MDESADQHCRICGAPSTVGCHGVANGAVYSEYYCLKCYTKGKRTDEQDKELDRGVEVEDETGEGVDKLRPYKEPRPAVPLEIEPIPEADANVPDDSVRETDLGLR